MSHEQLNQSSEQLILHQVEVITEQAQPGGGLYAIAAAKAETRPTDRNTFTPAEVYDIVVPLRAPADAPPRWQMVEGAPAKAKEAATQHRDAILHAATEVGMIRRGDQEDYARIDPTNAVVVVPGGANRTSIVRRQVAAMGIREAGIEHPRIYQFGSGQTVVAPIDGKGSPNKEHALLRTLAGEFLPSGAFTQFDANLATALAQGYNIKTIIDTDPGRLPADLSRSVRLAVAPSITFRRAIELTHPDESLRGTLPDVTLIEPANPSFEGGLDAVRAIEAAEGRDLHGKQLVIATNGQYRPMAELQAREWSQGAHIDMQPPVALGDEPGDVVSYGNEQSVTAARGETLYANELALLGRRATAHAVTAAKRNQQHYDLPGSVVIAHNDGEEYVHEPDGSVWPRTSGSLVYNSPDDPGIHV